MNLYEYNRALDALVDPETGEVADYEAYLAISMEREDKIEHTAVLVKNLCAEAEMIRAEEAALKARREPLERRAQRLKDYLSQYLDGERFDCPRVSLSFRRSTALDVQDAAAAADWLDYNGYQYMFSYGVPKLDKRAVSHLVKAGVEIPGVAVVERSCIQVR